MNIPMTEENFGLLVQKLIELTSEVEKLKELTSEVGKLKKDMEKYKKALEDVGCDLDMVERDVKGLRQQSSYGQSSYRSGATSEQPMQVDRA